ncbi:MAG: alanine racemase [bacterium]|nr:alanine racemase [bacterium]
MNRSQATNRPRLLNWIELDQAVLRKNIGSLAKLAGDRTLAICVKANAYGHGLAEMTSLLKGEKRVDYLTVHSVAEASLARKAGWDRKIMLLGPFSSDETRSVLELDLEPMIFEIGALEELGHLAGKQNRVIRTHLKLETGTNRQGITEQELPGFVSVYKKQPSLIPYGAAMHFANIEDTTNHEYAQQQLDRFEYLVKRMEELGIKPEIKHTASSAALILFDKTRFDLVRPGLSAYGYWPSKETYLSYRLAGGDNNLFEPVLSWKSRISQLKQVEKDSFIGYGCSYQTTADTKLAVVPVGYYDGYDRALSNLAYVLINGKRAPIRGRICMNLTMVDVTDIENVRIGDEVTLIGRDQVETIWADQLADWGGTINYEVLARLSSAIVRRTL